MTNLTEIVCVIDKSGSMGPRKADAIGGFNQFLSEQKKLPDEAYLTLVLFDTNHVVMNESTPIKEVRPLDESTYCPYGCTALLDAVGRTIDSIGARLDKLQENQKPSKVLVVILTDGEENSSHQFSKQQIKDKIEHQKNTYSWCFMYLGANQDAFAEAGSIGIPVMNTFQVNLSSAEGVRDSYSAMSRATASYRVTGTI